MSNVIETSSVALIAGRLVMQLFGGNQTNENMIVGTENNMIKNWDHYKQMLNRPYMKRKR
jgi:hypothetical protein